MKLNPKKFNFLVEYGKFHSHMVSKRGIEVNPSKIKAILDMNNPRSVREVQRLTGYLTVLNKFISRMGDKYVPLFDT